MTDDVIVLTVGGSAPPDVIGAGNDVVVTATDAGLIGPPPAHQISGPQVRFQNPDGTWGPWLTAPTGAKGDQGVKGDIGNAATIAVGSVTTGAPGSAATVVNVGDQHAAVLNITIPRGDTGAKGDKGDQGIQGAQGVQGPAGTIAIRNVTTGAPGSAATVTNAGTPSAAVLDLSLPQGAVGAQGPQGNTGAAATVQVGAVTTLAPGASATVTNRGTAAAAVLDFGIPQGAQGDATGAVRFDQAQTLTAPQKTQALSNIGAQPAGNYQPAGSYQPAGNYARTDATPYFSASLNVTNGVAALYGYSGDSNKGVLYLGSSGGRYLYWDGSNYNFNGANVFASNGRLWGSYDFSTPVTALRLAWAGFAPAVADAEPYPGAVAVGTYTVADGNGSVLFGGHRFRYLQFFLAGNWYTTGLSAPP